MILFDCNNILYRMYHAQQPRENQHGDRIESAQGSLRFFQKHCEKYEQNVQDDAIVVLDAEGDNFRHEISHNYKSERKGMPEDLKPQEDMVREALRPMGVRSLEKPGYEADDTLGMLASYFSAKNTPVMIVTTDKDMMQLVDDLKQVSIYNPASKKVIDEKAVKEKFGVKPSQVSDVLAIIGDKTDGIIGINNVGVKTAAKWINEFGSLDQVIKNSDSVKGKAGDALRAGVEQLRINHKLTTIQCDTVLLSNDELSEIESFSSKKLPDSPKGSISEIIPEQPKEKPKQSQKHPEPSMEQNSLF